MEVSEHRAESKWCPACAKWVTAAFPAGVSAPVQYGPGMQRVMSYLNIAQLLPCERTTDVCQDLFGHRPSAGSVVRAAARCAEKIAPAIDRIAVLLAMKQAADDARARRQKHIKPAIFQPLLLDYDRCLAEGLSIHPEVGKSPGKRGRAKQSKVHNLLMRMSEKSDEVLRFAHDLEVPFDNNQAERDLRMIKVQQKGSGCFRSAGGARVFCTIRSYLSTTRKHGLNLMDSIKSAFAGQPVDFAPE